MTTCAWIVDGVVENLIVAELDDPVPEGVLAVFGYPDWVRIGTKWDGKDFVRPVGQAPPKPKTKDGLERL